jgi:hypothetical protein
MEVVPSGFLVLEITLNLVFGRKRSSFSSGLTDISLILTPLFDLMYFIVFPENAPSGN